MDELNRAQKICLTLLMIVFFPLLLVFFLIEALGNWLRRPKARRKYKASPYYADFGQKFQPFLLNSPQYRFYNAAKRRQLPIDYHRQESNGLEYFIFQNTLFLFPDFDQLDYSEEKAEWQVDDDGNWSSLEKVWQEQLDKLENQDGYPVKLLVERSMLPHFDLSRWLIPSCIFLTGSYEYAFEAEESPQQMIIPQDTKELYERMLKTSDLGGHMKWNEKDGVMEWQLYDNMKLEIYATPGDCRVELKKRLFRNVEASVTHWHPGLFEIYDELCRIGRRGHVLVVRSFWGNASVLYAGRKEDCPYSPGKKCLLGKLYYLEAAEDAA